MTLCRHRHLVRHSALALVLPDALHANIDALLPIEEQRRMTTTSGTMHRVYGIGIAKLTLRFEEGDRQYAALASLLQRQKRLESIRMWNPGPLPTVSLAIAQGHCRCLRELSVTAIYGYTLSVQEGQYLVAAVETEGALPALEKLHIDVMVDLTTTVALAEWLGCGTLPCLKTLMLGRPPYTETVMADLTAMLEARVDLPNCQRLEEALGDQGWLENGSEETRLSLLSAALRSVDTIGLQVVRGI
jgi:hypothetical protein